MFSKSKLFLGALSILILLNVASSFIPPQNVSDFILIEYLEHPRRIFDKGTRESDKTLINYPRIADEIPPIYGSQWLRRYVQEE